MKKYLSLACVVLLCASLFFACGDPGYTPGVWEGKTYVNSDLGIKIELQDHWLVATREEIEEISETGAAAMGMSEAQRKQLKEKTIFDSMFAPENADVMIQITADNLKKSGGATQEDAYLASAKAQLEQMQAKTAYRISEPFDVTLGGRAYRAMEIVMGENVQRIYVSKVGEGYMSIVNIAANSGGDSGDIWNELESLFQPLNSPA